MAGPDERRTPLVLAKSEHAGTSEFLKSIPTQPALETPAKMDRLIG
jgi:hypothetical protein